MPVMLYIHGGAFVDGESDTHGPEYFMDENVILVVINYRLGAIGKHPCLLQSISSYYKMAVI